MCCYLYSDVNAGILQRPYYRHRVPHYVNLATFGGLVALELVKSLGECTADRLDDVIITGIVLY